MAGAGDPPWKPTFLSPHGSDFSLVLRLSIKSQDPSFSAGRRWTLEKAGQVLSALSHVFWPLFCTGWGLPGRVSECGTPGVACDNAYASKPRPHPAPSVCPFSHPKWQHRLQRGWVGGKRP